MEVMFSNANNNYFANINITGFIGELSDLDILINKINEVKIKSNKKVNYYIKNMSDFLYNLGLKDDILNKNMGDLSFYEYKCILLLKTISLKPKIIILNYFDLGVCEKYKRKLITFIRLINATYKINFVVVTNNCVFINDLTKHLIVMNNGIIKYQGNVLDAIKSGIIEKPEIIKFIDLANEKNAKLDYYLDNKELLKAIYRSVF